MSRFMSLCTSKSLFLFSWYKNEIITAVVNDLLPSVMPVVIKLKNNVKTNRIVSKLCRHFLSFFRIIFMTSLLNGFGTPNVLAVCFKKNCTLTFAW